MVAQPAAAATAMRCGMAMMNRTALDSAISRARCDIIGYSNLLARPFVFTS